MNDLLAIAIVVAAAGVLRLAVRALIERIGVRPVEAGSRNPGLRDVLARLRRPRS